MKFENIVKRISLSRESKRENIMPYGNFYDRVTAAGKLLDFVEDGKADKKIRYEARKYFVIACVSAMETYFKRTAQVFIDAKWIKNDFLDILRHDKISLADLLEIDKIKLSLGEIVSVSYYFQDLESINRIYSKMLGGTDFLEEVEGFKAESEEGKYFILINDYPNFRRRIGELIQLRHLIVHHEGFKGILGLRRLTKISSNLVFFVFAADSFLMKKIPED